jgi:hypothetical protein
LLQFSYFLCCDIVILMDVNNLELFFEGSIPSTTQREERNKIAITTTPKQTRL